MPIYDENERAVRKLKIDGPALSAIRRDLHFSQQELADKAHMSRSAIARYESEPDKGITGRAWRQLCKALGLRSPGAMESILLDDGPSVVLSDGSTAHITLYDQFLAAREEGRV